jgi:hypothetical protein
LFVSLSSPVNCAPSIQLTETVANGVPRLELSGIVTDEGVIFSSGSGVGLQPKHVAMHINASNVPANCLTLRSSQTGDEPHFRAARVFHTSVNTARWQTSPMADHEKRGCDAAGQRIDALLRAAGCGDAPPAGLRRRGPRRSGGGISRGSVTAGASHIIVRLGAGSLLTLRWRKTDSNSPSHPRAVGTCSDFSQRIGDLNVGDRLLPAIWPALDIRVPGS